MPNIALELGKQSASFGVRSAYGEQQDVDGIRVIPVAITWSGFGGGSDEAGNGGGGGGGGGRTARCLHPARRRSALRAEHRLAAGRRDPLRLLRRARAQPCHPRPQEVAP